MNDKGAKMTIYEKVEKLFEDKIDDNPIWANEILKELREIRRLLFKISKNASLNKDRDYFAFIKKFRKRMKPDVEKNIYPEVEYKGRRLGINSQGYLYDKDTLENLPRYEAFEVFRHFYEKEKKKDKLIDN